MELVEHTEALNKDARVALAAFNADYAAAQGEAKNPELDSVNPAFKSKFASLAATINAIVPAFTKHGIAIQQTPVTQMLGERLFAGVHTVLRHESGHVEDLGHCLMPVQKFDAQGIASCLTYSKRQSLQALACRTGELDDDANEAVGKPAPATQLKPGIGVHDPRPDTTHIDPAQVAGYVKRLAETFDNDLTDEQQEDAVYAMHMELCRVSDELYVAVADAMADNGVIGKQAWKTAIGNARKREKAAA